MFARSDGTNIYTASNEDTASLHGDFIARGHTLKDEIIAYVSVAVGVIGFSIFLFYYCTPLVKDYRKGRAAKRREELLKPFVNERRLYGVSNAESFSNYSSDSKEFELLVPKRVVPRDLVGFTKDNQAKSTVYLDPFLSRFPAPPPSRAISAQKELSSSSFSDANVSSDDLYISTPTRTRREFLHNRSFTSISDANDFSATFVISNSQDSISDNELKTFLPSPASQAQNLSPAAESPTVSPSRSANRIYAMVSPRSSSLVTMLSSTALAVSTSSKSQERVSESCRTGRRQFPTARDRDLKSQEPVASPVYAETILPRYLRDSCKASASPRSHVPCQAGSTNQEPWSNVQPTSSAAAEHAGQGTLSPKIESLPVQETVLTRATNYTRGLVGGSPPKNAKGLANTELQFEMVKRESILFL